MKHASSWQDFKRAVPFLIPACSFYALFYVVPAAVAVVLSLYKWNGLAATATFTGLSNYIAVLQSSLFWKSVVINLEVVVVSLVLQLSVALVLAALLMRAGRLMRLYRSLFFIPQVLSLVAVGMLWQMIYDPANGLLDGVLRSIGLHSIPWLGTPKNALVSMLITTTWVYFGFHTVLQMAGRAAIPNDLYEAAYLETKAAITVFFYVTLPLLRETILISAIMIVTGSFALLMGLFWIMTEGGPAHGTEILGIHMYVQAFKSYRLGYASSIAVVMVIFLMISVTGIIALFSRERVEY
jgi:raffinose/stachyose/melibiose transport system permease protein